MDTNLDRDTTTKKREPSLDSSPPVIVTRTFNAPVEQVWKVWANGDLMQQWWGPENYTSPTAKIDFRVGGKSLLAMKDSMGAIVWSGGVYKEIIPFKKIVTTDHFADEKGHVIPASEAGMTGEWPLECLITVEFSGPSKDQTKMTITHKGIPQEMHDDCVDGWNSSINKLQRLVEHH